MQPISKPPAGKITEPVTLEDCLTILLRGIQNHSVIADGADGQEFRAQLAALEGRLKGKSNAREIVDSAVEILDKHGVQAKQGIARQKSGLTAAATELSGAMKASPAMQANAERLSKVEEQIRAISAGDDLEAVKARLCADVAAARAEALQEQKKVGELVSGFVEKLDATSTPTESDGSRVVSSAYGPDPLTGLPSRCSAEAELARAHGLASDSFVALFAVRRLALINAKFGFKRGDQVLLKVVMHLAQSLPEYNNLFRWAPCAFLALTPPNTAYKDLRSKVQVIELTRMAPTLEWEGRSAMVPVALNCRIVSVRDFRTPYDLYLRLDSLAADA